MRAAVYTRTGEPGEVLSVAELEEPHAGAGQVRIAVRAAGVNPIDWKLVTGMMGGPPDGPKVPGVDAAGEVDEVLTAIAARAMPSLDVAPDEDGAIRVGAPDPELIRTEDRLALRHAGLE